MTPAPWSAQLPFCSTISRAIRETRGSPAFSCRPSTGKGIASALVPAIEDAARRLGYPTLYLFTTSAACLYAGLGWRALEQRAYRGEHIQVMDKAL